jgi:hypothetical protein
MLQQVVCVVITGNETVQPIRVWVGYIGWWKMPYCTENFDEETPQRKRVLETYVFMRGGYYN